MEISSRRSNLQVIADILRIRGTKTAVMYGANLSYAQTQKYLGLLKSQQLLEEVDAGRKRKYQPTQRGQQLLTLIESLEVFVDDLSVAGRAGRGPNNGDAGAASQRAPGR